MKQLISVIVYLLIGCLFITAKPTEIKVYVPQPKEVVKGKAIINNEVVLIIEHNDGSVTYRKLSR